MKYVTLALVIACFAGVLYAQNDPAVVVVLSNGTPIPNSGGITVAANDPFNSMALTYDITDAQNDDVGCTAVVTNIAAAVNWSEATFNKAAEVTPYQHDVLSTLGEFGPANTVHVVTLTFNDGTDDTIFSFTISVDTSTSGGGGLPGDDGGACTASGGGSTTLVVGGMLLAAVVLRRRRITS